MKKELNFIDLFAGIGGFREGFENACNYYGIKSNCTLTAEIKKSAINVYKEKYKESNFFDIRKLSEEDIKNIKMDFLLGGFVCKSFSQAGSLKGFDCDLNGDLFFQITKILKYNKPKYIILENVDNLVIHDKSISKHIIKKPYFETPNSNNVKFKEVEIGNTFKIVLEDLENLGYTISWEVLNTKDFNLPQSRNRIFIIGVYNEEKYINLNFNNQHKLFKDIIEKGLPIINDDFTKLLLSNFTLEELIGKKINDKRGNINNIHSWEFDGYGKTTLEQRKLLNMMLLERRKSIFKKKYNLNNDGLPLPIEDIETFFEFNDYNNFDNLKSLIEDLVDKKYLKVRTIKHLTGYDLKTGRLNFLLNQFINPNDFVRTLTATDADRHAVIENNDISKGLRRISYNELCDLFGFNKKLLVPIFNDLVKRKIIKDKDIYDLFGNSLGVDIVENIVKRILKDS